jgi:hypothetical protein
MDKGGDRTSEEELEMMVAVADVEDQGLSLNFCDEGSGGHSDDDSESMCVDSSTVEEIESVPDSVGGERRCDWAVDHGAEAQDEDREDDGNPDGR